MYIHCSAILFACFANILSEFVDPFNVCTSIASIVAVDYNARGIPVIVATLSNIPLTALVLLLFCYLHSVITCAEKQCCVYSSVYSHTHYLTIYYK